MYASLTGNECASEGGYKKLLRIFTMEGAAGININTSQPNLVGDYPRKLRQLFFSLDHDRNAEGEIESFQPVALRTEKSAKYTI